MSQSDRCRRLSVAPLAGVERQGRGSLGSGSLAVGISNSLPSGSRFIQGTHPFSGVLSQFDQGQSSGGRGLGFTGQRSDRTCSSSLSGLLEPVVCSYESLRSVEAGHRPLSSESESAADILIDGDSPVRTSVSALWRLDGVSRLEGCVLAGSDASGISQVPQVHGGREGVPVQGSLLWTLHRSSGFHPGHGSCFRYSSQDRGASTSLPRRLVASGFLSGAGSPCSGDSAPALQVFRNSRQLGEVSADSDTTDGVSGSHSGLNLFQGFSCPEESREASLDWRRILVLRKTASIILAGAVRSAVFYDPARPGGTAPHEVTSVHSAEALGSCGSICSGRMVSGNSSRSRLVVGSQAVGAGVSLEQVSPQLNLWSDASDVGWGAHLGEEVTSDLWAPEEVELSINVRKLLAIERALLWFAPQLFDSSVAVFADNATAIVYLRNQGGTHSPLLNSIAQRILRWAESLQVVLSPHFIMGKHNVLVDSLSRPNQIHGSEWTLKQEVFQDLCKWWPASIDLFATSLNHRCSVYFSPYHDRNALGTDALLQKWNGWQAYAFPPWSLIPAVLKKLRSSSGVLLTIIAPYWPQRPWFPDLLDLVVDGPVALPQSRDLLRQPHFHRFHLGVSRLSLHAWRLSSDLPVPEVSPRAQRSRYP